MAAGRERMPYVSTLASLTDVGIAGEIVPSLEGRVTIMDGATPGGHELGRADFSNAVFDPTGATGAIPALGWVNVAGLTSPTDAFFIGDNGMLAAMHRQFEDSAVADGKPRGVLQLNLQTAGSGRGTYTPANGRNMIGLLAEQSGGLNCTNGGQMTGVTYYHIAGAATDGLGFESVAQFASGYFATAESQVTQSTPSGTPQRALTVNLGSVNNPVPGTDGGGTQGGGGLNVVATAGALNAAVGMAQSGGTWQYLINAGRPDNSLAFQVDGSGNTVVGGVLSTSPTPATVAQCQTGGAYDPALFYAYSLIGVSNGAHGGPCLAINYGGWKVLAAISSLSPLSTS